MNADKRRFFSLFGLAFALLLAACAQGQTPVAPTLAASDTPGLQATETPAPPAPTETISPGPTHSVSATASLEPTRSPAETRSPEEQATQDAGLALRATESAILPGCTPEEHNYSPDGRWVAVECLDFFTGIYNLQDPTNVWVLPYGETFGLEYDNGNQMGNLHVIHWSAEGQYVYLAPMPVALDGAGSGYPMDGLALLRLDLNSGEIAQTLQPGSDLQFYSVSFSPDSRYLAYFRTWIEHPILNLVDMVNGTEQYIPLGEQYAAAGRVVWSPERDRMVVDVNNGDVYDLRYALLLIELENLDLRVLVENSAVAYIPVEWTADDQIILRVGYLEYSLLDLATGEISP